MANLTPIVEPTVNSVGNPITTTPKILFDKAIDVGSINESNFFIVSLRMEGTQNQDQLLEVSNAINDIVPAALSYRKVNLADNDDFTGSDYGVGPSAGELFRSEVTIKPKYPLRPNTNYAVIVSKHVSLMTVFDAQSGGNSGNGTLKTAGVYTGSLADIYTITITQSGDSNTAYYTWTRASDSHTSDLIQARARHIEIDRGVKIRFDGSNLVAGDEFVINVKPADKLVDIFSFNFATGTGVYKVPEDDKSGDLINLPVVDPNNPTIPATPGSNDFYVVSIFPELGASLVKIAAKAIACLYDVILQSKLETDQYNGWKFEFTEGGTAGSEVVTFTAPNLIQVQVEKDISTAKQVMDALNASPLINTDFEAFTACPTAKVRAGRTRITKGVPENKIIIKFNKNVNPATVADNIKVTKADVYPNGPEEELYFDIAVSGDTVTLTIDD